MPNSDTAVAIVGAGPVGLSAALRLAERGIESVILEAQEDRARDLRASTFHPPTLEMLDTLELAQPLFEHGLVTPHWQIRMHETGERALFDLQHIAQDTAFPFRLQCEQTVLCELAEALVHSHALIEIKRGWKLAKIVQHEDEVELENESAERLRARYVIGADGARSTVREACNFTFEGFTYPETTILATTTFPFHEHLEGLSNVNYCWSEHGTFSLLRLPDVWRCSLYSDADESLGDALDPQSIETKLQRIFPRDDPYPVTEIRPYRIHQRIVEHYRKGRIALAGDAAHLNSPSGGMGMNGGIHDAFALADTLAEILRGADETLLDRYSQRRKAVAEEQILKQAHRNRTRMQERDDAKRREELTRLQAIADNPEKAREHLLATSMIAGLRQAETME
ncbi:FAD-dependent oxidoreductase [Altererythrobacter lutimaris]|uniref:FAD-dependent monooxygenase n=1 Tax=Altererythrobacter lutimaris TaxID=2743979 RepID=A0A850HD37_9SPHN|nr:FAD-dependent oxidoreductase [Altererythrobacter lutimaris]NVE95001.1 FAD-dependent monooxygenase [Altererythrobacter lutimaris]